MSKYGTSEKGFRHWEMADDIVNNNEFRMIGGTLYMYYDGVYTPNVEDIVIKLAFKMDPTTSDANRKEVFRSIKTLSVDFKQFPEIDKYKIAFNNGVLDLRTLQFYTYNLYEYAVCNKVNWNYNPNAEDQPQVREQIKKWADNNKDIEKLLYQLIGYPMLVNCNLRTMFILYGRGCCGKTKFMEWVEYIYGTNNYSVFDLDKIDDRFNRAVACGKLFNYSDDLDPSYFEKPGKLKRMISGVSMQAENKGKDIYKAEFYSKLIISANEFPKIKMEKDQSAWQSRLNIIPFTHVFDVNPLYDVWEKENLKTTEAIEWIIKEAVLAIHDAVKAGEFCYNDQVMRDAFFENNNPFVFEASKKTIGDWGNYVDDFKKWFNHYKDDYGVKMSLNAFITMFNEMSETCKIVATTRRNKHTDKIEKYYAIREK